jgi:hypothetical protein
MTTTAEDTQAVLAIIRRLHSEIAELRETRLRLIDEVVLTHLELEGLADAVPGLINENDLRISICRIDSDPDLGLSLIHI